MSRLRTLAVLALLSAGLAGPAAAQGTHDHGSMSGKDMGSMSSMKPDPRENPSTKEFKAADMAMMKDMDVPYTGDADVDFRTHMIPHHKGAVEMAKVALKHAKDAGTKAMAQKIIDDQEKEISEMEAWLKQHGK